MASMVVMRRLGSFEEDLLPLAGLVNDGIHPPELVLLASHGGGEHPVTVD